MKRQSRTLHPYAAVEHRVLDSLAYADLSFSAQALLLLFARQLTKDTTGTCRRHSNGANVMGSAVNTLCATPLRN